MDTKPREDSLLRQLLSPGPACASAQMLGALRNGTLEKEEALVLERHLAECSRCQTELKLLSDFENAAPRKGEEASLSWITSQLERRFSDDLAAAGEKAHGGAVRRWAGEFLLRPLQMGGLAAAAAMVLAGVVIAFRETRPPELGSPAPAPVVFRSGELSVFFPAGDLREPPGELRWQPSASASLYSIRVMEVDRTELWSAETRQTAIALPAQVRARIVPRKPILWEVVARDSAGRALASSGTHQFQVRNQP